MSLGDLLGQVLNLRDLPAYLPPGLWKYWLVPLALLAAGPVAYYRIFDHRYHEAFLVRQEREALLRNLDNEHFHRVGALAIPRANTSPAEEVEIRAQDPEQHSDGSVTRRVALVYRDDVSRFSYALLAGHSVWVVGSTTSFEGGAHGVAITDALRRDYVEALVKESDKLVCIGLASSEKATPTENTRLSDDRSINLCRALHNIGFADATRQQAFGLSVGEPPPSAHTIDASLQRSVIIVGIFNSRRVPRPNDLVQALTVLVQVPGAPLSEYRREGVARKTFSGITRGPLNGRASGSWADVPDDGSNPLARQ